MKKILGWFMVATLLLTVQAVWADDMGQTQGMSTPGMSAAPAVKAKGVKKSKKKMAKEMWACPAGDYCGPKTADDKCPKCGKDLMKMTKEMMMKMKGDMKKEGMKEGVEKPSSSTVVKAYVCPMCGYTGDKAGKCPKCGTELVAKK
jgi:rubrerythrin